MTTKELVSEILTKKKNSGTTIDSVFFVGCGGSFAAQYPAKYFLERESRKLKVAMYTSNEFVYSAPKSCGPSSIVIACSMRGTAETGEAVKVASSLGATTISFYFQESAMTAASDYMVQYFSIAEDGNAIDTSNGFKILELAVEILNQTEGYCHYDEMLSGLKSLDKVYRKAKELSIEPAKTFAEECKDDKVIYVMGSGPSNGAAYIFSICNLMEMQWIHSPTVNFGELLHGPFEAIEDNVPILCLLSTGRTRPIDDRAMRFLKKYDNKLFVLDAKELGLCDIDDSVNEFFCPLVFSSVLQNVYVHELGDARNHPYTTRRYMWKVEY